MQLHRFEANIGDSVFRAYTRDRAGAKLRGSLNIASLGTKIEKEDWFYLDQIKALETESKVVRKIITEVKKNGVAFRYMPKVPTRFYVFDWDTDVAKYRIYSADRQLGEVKRIRKQLELNPRFGSHISEEEVYVGEIEIRDQIDAQRVGISDYESLVSRKFAMVTIHTKTPEESLSRKIMRDPIMRDLEEKAGIKVLDVTVREIIRSENPAQADGRLGEVVGAAEASTKKQKEGSSQHAPLDQATHTAVGKRADSYHRYLEFAENTIAGVNRATLAISMLFLLLSFTFFYKAFVGDIHFTAFGIQLTTKSAGMLSLSAAFFLALYSTRGIISTIQRSRPPIDKT